MENVSIKDVARIAGVSIATVSRCINSPEQVRESTRSRVQRAIRETGYSPNGLARSFRRGKTQIIVVVLPSVGDPFFTGVMRGIRSVASRNGYSLLINETQLNTMTEDEIGSMVASRLADGIVLLASLSPFGTRVLSAKSRRALPIVIGCEAVSDELADFPGVHIDNEAAARELTGYLASLGHRRIAFISGQEDSLLTRDREKGYAAAMQAAGLSVEPGWVVQGGLTVDGAIEATRRVRSHPRPPTAIFCANDEMAIGCLHAVKEAGDSVPDDVSVVGFDDTRYAAVTDPPLTTVRQPAEEIGRSVMNRLLKEIERETAGSADPLIVPHELVIRRSAARPPR
ncbi:MAG: LacI family DNA-binding transcriptional regulator [Xanthomonadales bacterium]|nr:LacI family DNA-binding transcriptional regulator [Xanthomonadales bacterium]